MNLNNFKELKKLMSFLKEHPDLTVEELCAKFAEPEPREDWEPKVDENYIFLKDNGDIGEEARMNGDNTYEYRLRHGNVFNPVGYSYISDYANYLNAKAEFLTLIKKLNKREGWVADFTDNDQKSSLFYHWASNEIRREISYYQQCYHKIFYFKPGLEGEIIETLGEEKIKLAITGE